MPNSVFPGLHDRLAHGVACELALFRVKSPVTSGRDRNTRFASFANMRLVRPGMAFCSCTAMGTPESLAATSDGKEA